MSKNTILSELTAEIAGLAKGTSRDEVGEVVRAGDGVAEIRGLDGVLATELIIFETGKEYDFAIVSLDPKEHKMVLTLPGKPAEKHDEKLKESKSS